MANHVILRQIVELETPHSGEGHQALGEQLSHISRKHMPVIMDNVFNRFGNPDATTRIDRLEVEIECLPGETLEEAISLRLEGALQAALENASQRKTERPAFIHSESEALLFFLEHGYLPWYAGADITAAEWEYRIAEALAKDATFRSALFNLLKSNHRAWERILRHFTARMPQRIVESRWKMWSEDDFMILQTYLRHRNIAVGILIWGNILNYPDQMLAKVRSGKPEELLPEPAGTPSAREMDDSNADFPEEGIFIRNAGAVLVHPFLVGLFTATGYYVERQLNAPHRAMGLLHYAVTGSREGTEWELPLLKVLCGIPLSEPLPVVFELSEKEELEVEKMLDSLIGHWTVLKNTSIAALRESFFQREGRLTFTNGSWHLKIEQRAYDVLLEHLPWGIGMIKLPWMTEMLTTEWT